MADFVTQHASELTILLMGLVLLLMGGIRCARQWRWLNGAEKANARIIALEKVPVDVESYHGVYTRPVFRYRTDRGMQTGKAKPGPGYDGWKPGDEHTILHNAKTPGHIALAATAKRPLLLSLGVLCAGVALLVLALMLW